MADEFRPVVALSQRTLFETSAVGIAITDGRRVIQEANLTLAVMLGYDDPSELQGVRGADLMYSADADDGTPDKRHRRKDGTPVWLRLKTAPIAGTELFFTFFEDIGDEKAAQSALAEQAALLARAQQVGGIGSWIWYPGEQRNIWSEQAARIFGFSAEEAASEDPELFFAVIHPDDSAMVKGIAWESFDAANPLEVEYRIVRRSDGAVRWVREQAVVEPGPDGTPARMSGAVTDVTERKQVELELLQKTTLLERAHEVAGFGTYFVDVQRQTILLSPEVARMYGIGDEPVEFDLAEYRDRFVHPDDRPESVALADRAYLDGTALTVEHRIIRVDGTVIWVRARSTIEDDGRGGSFVLGVGQDVTEQKRVELELRETAAVLERAQQAGRVGTWAWYLPERRTRYSSEALEIMGYPPDAVGPDLITNLIHPDDAATMKERSEHAFATASEYTDEFRIVHHGQVRWLHLQGDVETDVDGRPLRMVGVLMDITEQRQADKERRELEERLRQSQKLDALGQLAGGIAHDFNNLLTVISGASTLALMDIDDEGVRANIEEVVHAASRASELTQKLLVFARRQPLERTALDLNDVVADSRRLLERLIEPSIEIKEELSSEPLPVVADLGQLEQVLLNLALNARDAMPVGGVLTIRTEVDRERSRGRISVEDTGTGIPPPVLQHIFEPFFTTKDTGKGTGLGLATVHGIVDAAGGEIDVSSDEGTGTVFTVTLPLATGVVESERGPANGGATAVAVRGLRALLVDDDDHVRATLTRLLGAAGCSSVVAVKTGQEALDAVDHESEFDLLVTDLMMPQMNGIDLSLALRAQLPTLPILYISGSSDNASLAAQQPNGVFLAKPFTVSDIAEAIARLVPTHP